jgi:hypothetical protein
MVANTQDRHAINLMYLVSLSSVKDRGWFVFTQDQVLFCRAASVEHATTQPRTVRASARRSIARQLSALMCRVGRLSCCASV